MVNQFKQTLPHYLLLIAFMLMALGMTTTVQVAAQSATPQGGGPLEVVATGLQNPRGVACGADGAVYVAEAGSGGDGGCITAVGEEACYGATGAVTKIQDGSQMRVVEGLGSIITESGEVLGPQDVDVDGESIYVLVGLGTDPNERDKLGDDGMNLGVLVHYSDVSREVSLVADVAGLELVHNPDGGLLDSNPFDILMDNGDFIITDAGANAVWRIVLSELNRTVAAEHIVAVFEDRMVPNPFGEGEIPMQPVPTRSIKALGEPYDILTAQLTGFPFPVGGANVYGVDSGEAPEVLHEGFTTITGLARGAAGDLYVLEMAAEGLLPPPARDAEGLPAGQLTRISPNGNRVVLDTPGLLFPTGVAYCDGYVYMSNLSVTPVGQVVRLQAELPTDVALATIGGNIAAGTTLFVIAALIGLTGAALLVKRRTL